MATVVPQTRTEMIAWFAERVDDWSANAAALGLDLPLLTGLATLVENAQNAEATAVTSRIESKANTVIFHNEADALRAYGAALVKTIKATIETTGDNNLYALALIPPPSPPTPAGAPEQPTDLKAEMLLPFGIKLSWKGSTSQGAYFGVWRKVSGETNYTLVKTVNDKFFEDRTLATGVEGVTYYITGVRDAFEIASVPLPIQFGPGGAGTALTLAA